MNEGDGDYWWDEAETSKKIEGRLDDFARSQFPAINRVIVDCLEEYRTETG